MSELLSKLSKDGLTCIQGTTLSPILEASLPPAQTQEHDLGAPQSCVLITHLLSDPRQVIYPFWTSITFSLMEGDEDKI